MAIYVKELMNAVDTDEDYQKRGTMSRRFLVTTYDPIAARTADGIPARNSQHPLLPDYRLDSISTTPTGSGHTYVDCQYSNDRRGAFRTVNKDSPSWYHWGWNERTAEVDYYLNVREKRWFSEQADPVDVWTLYPAKLAESRMIRPLFVRLERVFDVRWLDPIRIQKNRIHRMPDGQKYRFLGGQVSQKDDVTFDVQYEWELDDGTPIPFGANSPDGRVRIPFNLELGGLLRQPYYRINPLASPDPRTTPHSTFTTSEYVEDLDGWRQLPGANRVV